ncbi:beta-1,3-glucosyltransferase [Sitodiplosis mosellana]|uniref:beta-1,3-glucosyltransferase n=1 Tax=Sitodiplosis mosellana TaxID=263140 RepID=UPI002443BD58|nr:beta-1,3-glucosyltransferase [Sitodiplosis mosellana]XP_055295646.1 beta-1,3-glucosyltransferase [Sitodiplosis mosellana]XP_055295648.1 beta-1,3-glucosyltransferase [Sitodiplosis mosellana]XP_055295649.1 beta-1,3-glucosyltransferase [Sitodiplosis mosellana]
MNAIRYYSCAVLALCFQLSCSLAPHELTFLIISQNFSFSAKLANELKNNILHQLRIEAFLNNNEIDLVQQPKIILSHETFNSIGSWAITPILASSIEYIDNIILSSRNLNAAATEATASARKANALPVNVTATAPPPEASQTKWLILCEDQSIVDLKALINNLQNEDYTKKKFLGYGLRDAEATIIHHFAFFENPSWFLYPLFRAGVAISIPLLKILAERVRSEKNVSDFFIDASHELSLFAWNKGKGHQLTEAPYFCLDRKSSKTSRSSTLVRQGNDGEGNGCAIYSRSHDDSITQSHLYSPDTATGTTKSSFTPVDVTINQIFFAIKTWSKNHEDRVPVIQRTWAKEVKHIRYYSDVADPNIPTISTNIENTEHGHCAKTLVILQRVWEEIIANKQLKPIKYVVLSDDDTLFGVSTLLGYLKRFNANADVYLGERYGYQLLSRNGFNYITGGGGIVFSLSVIEKLVQNCRCPSSSSPDDMIIALCLQRIGIEPIHSSRFHQARPIDYPEEVLLYNKPISFHKFWQIDPYYVYEHWLRQSDTNVVEANKYKVGHGNEYYCSKNQNELCHRNIYDGNN